MTDKELANVFELAVCEKAKRYALDEHNYSLDRLYKMKDDFILIIESTEKFNASAQAKITLLAIEAAILYRTQQIKDIKNVEILGAC